MVLYNLKGQSNEIFVLYFIPYSNLPGPLTKQWVKIFLFWLRIRGDIQIFGLKNWLAGGMVFPGRLTRQCMYDTWWRCFIGCSPPYLWLFIWTVMMYIWTLLMVFFTVLGWWCFLSHTVLYWWWLIGHTSLYWWYLIGYTSLYWWCLTGHISLSWWYLIGHTSLILMAFYVFIGYTVQYTIIMKPMKRHY